ncbi:mucin-4-like isoform X48 [Anopheles funestus]|uniref:mucin-4-like isoform X48 n=1 Tax=Anopheles funestus TaxID=62324 RepID=UPI0020C69B66|nr:mucin-4-like isoform X48 [Anopheles funestus]
MFSLRGAHIYVFPNGNNEKRMKIEVNSNRVTIGAHPLNNIRLHTLNAERLHCKIFADSSNSVTIENYSQKNPIFVNGVCVERRAKLHDNDRFEVAGSAFLWNFDPSHIRVVSKPKKRPNLHSRRKTITLKRIRSTGDITKQSMIKVPRAVGLMLDEYRKRRTIHSTMSAQSLNNIGRNVKNCEEIDLTNQTNAHAESSTQAALDITSSDLSSCITPVIEKENILHSHIKEQKTKLTAQISATKRRHLACHTPVSNLIDLTTPPAKSRITPVVRKPISAKAVQSPRLLDVINIVTPSPNKKGRSTPNSLRAAVATPKRTLLKSAIKNSRANESVGANNTPIPSQSTKKTPNVKLNTLRTNTPKVTPASSKSSSIKIRKHLISTLNEKKGDVLLKPDSPIAIINTGRFSKHSTPTVGKGDRTPKRGNLCVTPKAQRVVQNVIDDHNNEVTNATIEKSAGESCASVLPIIDVQSIIRKPNRTTQIRSARYSDITPHESFADGLLPLATPAEEKEFLLETESTPLPAYMFQDELKSINNMHTNFNPNRNSCSSIVATVSTESSNIRKTMSDFSSSLSGSPLRRFSHKLMQTNIQPDNDWKKDENTNEFESDIDTLAKDADEHGMLASNDLEPPVQKDMVSTPELRHSWRHTRKCIGSAFTSLNTSRPQLDLTAEIDESLVVIEDEEPAPEQKELYNMECSEAFSTTNEQYDLQCPTVKNRATVHMENVPNVSTGPTFESTPDILCSSALEERSAEPSACNTVESTEFPVEHVIEDALEAEDHSAEELLHVDSSEVQSSNILEKGEEMMELMEVMSEAATEQVLDSTSDIFSASALEERSAEPSACSTVESTELPVEHVIEDAPEAEDHSAEELLHVDSSEVQTSNILEKGKEMMEPMEVMSEAATEEVLDSASDVLSASALEERSAEPSACSTVESTELPVKHVIEDAPEAEDHSAEELLHVDSSEVQTSNILEKGKEMMEPMEVMCEAATEQVLDSASDVLSVSALEEGSAEPSACSTVESTEFPVEHVVEDAPEAEDHSAEELLHVDSSEVQTSNILEKGKEMMEPMEIMSEAATEQVLDSTSDILSASALEERSAEPSACNTVESTEFPVEHVIEDAPEAEDHFAEELLHVDSSEVQTSNILEKGKEMMEPMEVMCEAATEQVLDSASDIISASTLEKSGQYPFCHDKDENLHENVGRTGMTESTPKISQRRLYTKKNYSSVTPDNKMNKETPLFISDFDYLGMSETPKSKAKKTNIKTVDCSSIETRKQLPKRVCRGKIHNLSEDFLAGDSPAPKFVKSKVLTEDDQHESNTVTVTDGSSFTDQHFPKQQSKASATRSGRSRKNVLVPVTSNSSGTMEVTDTEPDKILIENNTPVRRGRTRKQVLVSNEDSNKEMDESIKVNENYPSVQTRKTALEGESVSHLGPIDQATGKYVEEKNTSVRRGRPRKQVLVANDMSTKSKDNSVLHSEQIEPLETENNINENETPVRAGRTRKKVLVAEIAKVSKAVEVIDTEQVLHQNVGTKVDKTDTKSEQTEVVVTENQRKVPADKPAAVRRARPRKNAPKTESSILIHPDVTIAKNVTPDEPHPTEDKLDEKTGPVGHPSTDQNLEEKDAPPAVRRGRAHKKVPEVDVTTVVQPVKKGRGKKVIETVEEPIAITENVTPDERHPTEDKLDEKTGPVGHPSTDKNLQEKDAPPAVRRGRAQKKVPEVDVSTVVQPVKKGRGKRVTETVEEPIPITENVTPDERRPTEDKLDDKTGTVGHLSIDKNLEEKDAPPAVRRGRAHKKVPEVDVSTVVQPVKKGRGKKITEMVEESIAITENVTPDERHPTEDKLDEKTGSVGHPSAEKNLEEEDAPPAVRRGRAHKKVPEVDVTTVVQPVKKGRGKKVTETVEEPIAITENVTPDERHPTEDKLDDKTGPVGHPSSDKNLEEKHAPPAVRRGRAHKKVSEVDVSTVVQPVKKGRGKKVTEMAEEKEQDIVTPRKTGRKRKINMQIDPQESEENQKIEDTNEIQPESNRSGGVAQEEDSEKTTEYPNEKKTKKSAAPQAKSKSRKTVKKGDESVSANTSAVKNEAESIDTNVPRRTRAKRN